MAIKFILIFEVEMYHKVEKNVNPLQSFLLVLCLFMTENITCRYFLTTEILDDNLFETSEE